MSPERDGPTSPVVQLRRGLNGHAQPGPSLDPERRVPDRYVAPFDCRFDAFITELTLR
ncbi:hypothetical protein [Natronomonas sp.]|uniref:hypothetical protein n=1 Tax=Natronomonas sp. TaxID=2184060 RepID=UPI00398A3DFE